MTLEAETGEASPHVQACRLSRLVPYVTRGTTNRERGRAMDEATMDRMQDAIAKTVAEFEPSGINLRVTIHAFDRAVEKQLSAEDRARMNAGRMSDVDTALDRHSEAFAQALRGTGVPSGVVDLLMSWMTVQLQARALRDQAVTWRLIEVATHLHAPQASAAKSLRTTLTARGQVTLNKEVLRHLGVAAGARVEVSLLPEGRVELRAAPHVSSR